MRSPSLPITGFRNWRGRASGINFNWWTSTWLMGCVSFA
jgi:hypothetical protein